LLGVWLAVGWLLVAFGWGCTEWTVSNEGFNEYSIAYRLQVVWEGAFGDCGLRRAGEHMQIGVFGWFSGVI
jgi:hypothetical protein